MTLKNGLNILCFSLLAFLVTACLGNNGYEGDEITSTDAQIWDFSISHDSIPILKEVKFSIDHATGTIYNHDSVAYQTEINYKAVVHFTTIVSSSSSETTNVLNITNAGDSTWLKQGDSIDILAPLVLRVYAMDGVTRKEYTVKPLGIHQIDPDSVQYQKVASGLSFLQTDETKTISFQGKFLTFSKIGAEIQLHSSTNAINWSQETLSGLPLNTVIKGIQYNEDYIFAYTADGGLYRTADNDVNNWQSANPEYPVKSVLGFLKGNANAQGGLSVVVEKDGKNVFAFDSLSVTGWAYGEVVPAHFPLYEFSNFSYEIAKIQRITNIGGASANGDIQNAVWSTTNGLYWAKISTDENIFPVLTGLNAFYYNNEFWLINGKLNDGAFNEEVYYSIDGGVTWQKKVEKYRPQGNYNKRYSASVVMDSEGKHFYVIGGKQGSIFPEIWKGFLNRKDFN
jgi:hypothetical protein